MSWKIALVVVLVVFAILGALIYGSLRFGAMCRKNGKHEDVLGQVVRWQKAGIPGYVVGTLKYTRKGYVGKATTCMIRKEEKDKLKRKMMWDLATYFVGPKKMRDASPKTKAKGSTKAKQKSLSRKTTKTLNKASNKPVKGKATAKK